jgi:hypothetical protein
MNSMLFPVIHAMEVPIFRPCAGSPMDSEQRDVTSSCRIRIDKEGKWYFEGNEIINPLVLRAFCEALETDEEGRHRVVIRDELCYIEVEDTPFVISAIRGDQAVGLYLRLNTLETFPLDPTRLCIGQDNVLYATLENGMKVRFTRSAYYSLALMMEEDQRGNIILKIKDIPYPICPVE